MTDPDDFPTYMTDANGLFTHPHDLGHPPVHVTVRAGQQPTTALDRIVMFTTMSTTDEHVTIAAIRADTGTRLSNQPVVAKVDVQ